MPRPDSNAALETELLFGEGFTIYEEKHGWVWGQAAFDGYVGYAHMTSLGARCGADPSGHRAWPRRC